MLMRSLNSHEHPQQQQQQVEEFHELEVVDQPPATTALHSRQLLIRCADLISRSDFTSAHRLLSILSGNSSGHSDATERLVHHFTRALFHRLNDSSSVLAPRLIISRPPHEYDDEALHSCYLTLNKITPFIRFCHLTANQAILDSINENHKALHIIDFDIMHGLQWPPFMQALADRPSPPFLRLTATGTDLNLLHRTGDRLLRFARSLNLRFQFHPLHYHHDHDLPLLLSSPLSLFPDEALAVNCVLFLHRLLDTNQQQMMSLFLSSIKALNPLVVTLAEREANFSTFFSEALDHYAAVFESLEATLPPSSRERMGVEQIWLGREIGQVVRGERRGQRFESWEMIFRRSGFSNVELSPFALSQAKLLLRLHYPSEGYLLHINNLNHSVFLGWQNRPLFSVSSWH